MGEGRGRGDRPEEQTGTNFYDSQARTEPGRGKAVLAGQVRGPNIAGDAREQIKAALEAGLKDDEDPLTDQRLPRAQRELARQYFDAFREGR